MARKSLSKKSKKTTSKSVWLVVPATPWDNPADFTGPNARYVPNTAAVKPTPTTAISRRPLPRYASMLSRKTIVANAQGFTPSNSPANATAAGPT